MRQFQHTVTPDDTAVKLGTGDLDVLATPRLILWCESASFQVCQKSVDPDHTTVGTMVKFEHTKGSPVGTEVTIECAEPINDGRRLVFATMISSGLDPTAAGLLRPGHGRRRRRARQR